MTDGWSLHHIGVAVAELDPAIEQHQRLFGGEIAIGPLADPRQRVAAAFLRRPGEPLIELVAPLGPLEESPLARFLRGQIGAYHLCYVVDDLERALAFARERRAVVVSGPTPAVAFGGRRVAWFFLPAVRQLTELLERGG